MQDSSNPVDGGLWLTQAATAELYDTEISQMAFQGILASENSRLLLRKVRVVETKRNLVWICNGSSLHAEDCEFARPLAKYTSVAISNSSTGDLNRCHIHEGLFGGVGVSMESVAALRDCQVVRIQGFGIHIEDEQPLVAKPCMVTILGGQIRDNTGPGILTRQSPNLTVIGSDLRNNGQGALELSAGTTLNKRDVQE